MRTKRPISINNSLAQGICNYSCTLCSVNKKSYCGPKEYQPVEVTEKLIERVHEAAASGVHVRYIANAGDGEPTLHPEFTARMQMFGKMIKEWDANVPVPEVSVVSNGYNLSKPGVVEAVAENKLSLIISFPTPDPESYGELMVGDSSRGHDLLKKVVPGIESAVKMAAEGKLQKLYFHISPPERTKVRRDFQRTIQFLSELAENAGLGEINLVMFPSTSNRSGLVRNWVAGTDMYRDLFRRFNGKKVNNVKIRMKLVVKRFFNRSWELLDLLKSFRFPCMWNANFFIAANGSSICCNDQSMRNVMGNIMHNSLEGLMTIKENHRPGKTCAACDQRPEKMKGSLSAVFFSSAAKMRMALDHVSKRKPKPEPASITVRQKDVMCCGDKGQYTMSVASSEKDRLEAWNLVYQLYGERGYTKEDSQQLWYGIYDAIPDAMTFLARENGELIGTLTLVPDSPLGLPADGLYGYEMESIRKEGRRPCEIISFACGKKKIKAGFGVTLNLFKYAYLTASRIMNGTDLITTINPRHTSFYEKRILMSRIGEEKPFQKVSGAPAVLMGLDLVKAQEMYLNTFGDAKHSVYRFFINPETEPVILKKINRQSSALGRKFLRKYFVENKPLMQSLSGAQLSYMKECYPSLEKTLSKKNKLNSNVQFSKHVFENNCNIKDSALEALSVNGA